MHRLKAALGLGAVVLSASALLTTPASADPRLRPVARPADVVGVGGDITEDLFHRLSFDYNVRPHAASARPRLASIDSVGSPVVRTKAGCQPIARPDGSSAGITALASREILPNGQPCIDFARATRPVLPGDPPNLRTVPIVLDAVDWVANAGGNAPASLTQDQLAAIYECRATTWNQVGGTSAARIEPMLPSVGPGISAFLTLAFGITFADLGPCVFQGVQQDDGTDPRIAGNPNALVFYSVGKYLGQAVYHHNDKHGALRLGRIADRSAAVLNHSSGRVEINIGQVGGVPPMLSAFVIEQFVAYLVDADGNPPAGVRDLFVGAASWLCTSSRARADVADFGFLPLPAGLCGVG